MTQRLKRPWRYTTSPIQNKQEKPTILKRSWDVNSNRFHKFFHPTTLGTRCGDIAYNPRRNFLGAISRNNDIAYHLFTIDSNFSTTGSAVKLCRKAKWHPQYSSEIGAQSPNENIQLLMKSLGNIVFGLDFHPNGEVMGTIDRCGVLLLSDVNTNCCTAHLNMPLTVAQSN